MGCEKKVIQTSSTVKLFFKEVCYRIRLQVHRSRLKSWLKGRKNLKMRNFRASITLLARSMSLLRDSSTTSQDELKIAESLNYHQPAGYVSKYAADQVLASWREERAEPFNNESISCIEFKDRKKDTKYKAGSSTISTTQSTQRLFAPYLSQNNSGIGERYSGIYEIGTIQEKKKTEKTIVDARFCYKQARAFADLRRPVY